MSLFSSINQINKKFNLDIDIEQKYYDIILRIFNGNLNDINLNDGNIINYVGLYYEYVKHNLDEAKKYYLMAIENGNAEAMNNLTYYYEDIEKDYDEAKKYYLMAVEKGCIISIDNLARYYQDIEKNYDKAKKYYLMAIENGNAEAMNNLARYYEDIEKNYDKAKKYYLMAIENGNAEAMNNLACYYEDIKKNYDEAKKYYLMAIDKGNIESMYNLAHYYEEIEENYEEAKKYYLMAIKNDFDINKLNTNLSGNLLLSLYHQYGEKYYKDIKCINIYKNKCNLNYKIEECPICVEEDVKCIPLECSHFYCTKCYVELINSKFKCAICNMNID